MAHISQRRMVEGEGFEPSKAKPTDLQSAPFGHLGTPPGNLEANYLIISPTCQPKEKDKILLAKSEIGF